MVSKSRDPAFMLVETPISVMRMSGKLSLDGVETTGNAIGSVAELVEVGTHFLNLSLNTVKSLIEIVK
jgi:hypothetical protein